MVVITGHGDRDGNIAHRTPGGQYTVLQCTLFRRIIDRIGHVTNRICHIIGQVHLVSAHYDGCGSSYLRRVRGLVDHEARGAADGIVAAHVVGDGHGCRSGVRVVGIADRVFLRGNHRFAVLDRHIRLDFLTVVVDMRPFGDGNRRGGDHLGRDCEALGSFCDGVVAAFRVRDGHGRRSGVCVVGIAERVFLRGNHRFAVLDRHIRLDFRTAVYRPFGNGNRRGGDLLRRDRHSRGAGLGFVAVRSDLVIDGQRAVLDLFDGRANGFIVCALGRAIVNSSRLYDRLALLALDRHLDAVFRAVVDRANVLRGHLHQRIGGDLPHGRSRASIVALAGDGDGVFARVGADNIAGNHVIRLCAEGLLLQHDALNRYAQFAAGMFNLFIVQRDCRALDGLRRDVRLYAGRLAEKLIVVLCRTVKLVARERHGFASAGVRIRKGGGSGLHGQVVAVELALDHSAPSGGSFSRAVVGLVSGGQARDGHRFRADRHGHFDGQRIIVFRSEHRGEGLLANASYDGGAIRPGPGSRLIVRREDHGRQFVAIYTGQARGQGVIGRILLDLIVRLDGQRLLFADIHRQLRGVAACCGRGFRIGGQPIAAGIHDVRIRNRLVRGLVGVPAQGGVEVLIPLQRRLLAGRVALGFQLRLNDLQRDLVVGH